jgi:mono/diheme cytochrome c family protein
MAGHIPTLFAVDIMRSRSVHVLLWVLGLALAWPGAPALGASMEELEAELAKMKVAVAQLQRESMRPTGQDLYRAACATCHGVRGDSQGAQAGRFQQRPTDFTQGVYKLRSTSAKVLLPGDLERTIREGMPGTEMVPFRGVLSETGIRDVAEYVRSLASKVSDPAVQAEAQAKRVEIPAERPPVIAAGDLEKAKQLYVDRCVECHGDFGEGSEKEKDDWGFRVYMNDFRGGVYKNGTRDADLYRAILSGMNGTSMGQYAGEISPEEAWTLVDYIRTLERKPSGLASRLYNWLLVERPSGFNYGSR